MPRTRRVTIDVPEPLWEHIEARVRSGEFADPSDAVASILMDDNVARLHETFEEELLRRLRALPAGATAADGMRLKREIYDRRHAELKALLQEGIDEADRGETTEFDVGEFLADARRRLAAEEDGDTAKRETA